MASGGRRNRDSENGGGPSFWGILGGLAGGLALGGLAVYGASKLVDALNAEENSDAAAEKAKEIEEGK
jgi:hypothetical protein